MEEFSCTRSASAATGEPRRSWSCEVIRVDLLIVLPFLRDRLLCEDRLHGADRLAVSALDARARVDVELGRVGEAVLVLARMDAVDGAHLDAGGVLRADAPFRDDVHAHLRAPLPRGA